MGSAVKIVVILSVINSILPQTTKDVPCPKQCTCYHSKQKSAKCYSLTYIPRFPKKITSVMMMNGHLHFIVDTTFQNLTFNRVYALKLRNNGIKNMTNGAFMSLKYLITVEISNETSLNTSSLYNALKTVNREEIKSIIFQDNMWSRFPNKLIDLFPNLRVLSLRGNNLDVLDWNKLSSLSKLYKLDFQKNNIRELSEQNSYFPSLDTLFLNQNRIEKIPEWCGHHIQSRFPQLKTLRLDYNFLDETGIFRCLPNLRRLSLGNNRISKLTKQSFKYLKALEVLYMPSVGQHLNILKQGLFDIPSLRELFIQTSGVKLLGDVNTWFTQIPNLRAIDISDNFLPSADGNDILKQLLFPLALLKSLFLDRLGILHIPIDFFSHFISLELLSLRQNKIVSFSDGTKLFGGLKFLKRLDLFGNRISFIGKHSFTKEMIKSLKEINLSSNQYICNCDLVWFIEWAQSNYRLLDSFPRNYLCSEPVKMRFQRITTYRPTKEECFPWNPMYTTVISVSFVLLLFIIFIVLVIRCKPTIKNYLYLIKIRQTKRQGYFQIENSNNYLYDAFVVYCDSDRKWVHTDLLNKVEKEEGLRLCVHHRDFEPGEAITSNIDNFLKRSWKVIVVLSNAFTKSEWCQWEVDVVHERRRRMGKDIVLPIMIENINTNHMTSQICMLLDSTPFLRYQKGQGEEIFWKCVVESLRKPIAFLPVAEL